MRVGDRVEVFAAWSSFFGMKGEVQAITPHLMVLIDGDRLPLRFGDREVRRVEPPPQPWVAGE